jgi:hypothetical protein
VHNRNSRGAQAVTENLLVMVRCFAHEACVAEVEVKQVPLRIAPQDVRRILARGGASVQVDGEATQYRRAVAIPVDRSAS